MVGGEKRVPVGEKEGILREKEGDGVLNEFLCLFMLWQMLKQPTLILSVLPLLVPSCNGRSHHVYVST